MKIAIAGTRGIPNRYGGFEQFAENLSQLLADKGHDVWVYNPNFHDYKDPYLGKVKIISKNCPENLLGGFAHFWYDYLCMKDAAKREADLVIMCGYGTSAPGLMFLNLQKTKLAVNMDGMELHRKKYSSLTRKLLLWSERKTVKNANFIIADHQAIKKYYTEKYNINPIYIPYGADIQHTFKKDILIRYDLTPNKYFISVARDEPDNQVDEIIFSWKNSACSDKIVIVTDNKKRILKHRNNKNIVVIKGLYDTAELNSLRHFSTSVIHGHRSGGTNPSLLEAMASGALIVAHDNVFNQTVLKSNALFYKNSEGLQKIISDLSRQKCESGGIIENNLSVIQSDYRWEMVAAVYEGLLYKK